MDPREYDWQMGDLADQSNYPPGVDPSAIGTAVKNWWSSQPSWAERAKAENQRTVEAFQRGGMGEIARQLATDTTEAQDLAGGFGGTIKSVGGPLSHQISAIKLPKPVGEYAATFKPSGTVVQPEIEPAALQGKIGYPTVTDTTRGAQTLTSLGGYKLPQPVPMQAGPQFPAIVENQPHVWMADQGNMSKMVNKVGDLAQGGREVVVVPTALSPAGGDYSHHVWSTLTQKLGDTRGISNEGVAWLNGRMRELDPKFPGVRADTERLLRYFDQAPRDVRTTFVQSMDTRQAQNFGFPDVAEVRAAAINPDLLHAPLGSSGFSSFRLDPKGSVVPADIHGTYTHAAPGTNVGSLGVIAPPELMFPGPMSSLRTLAAETGKPLNKYVGRPDYYFQGRIPEKTPSGVPLEQAQLFDQAWVDRMSKYKEQFKKVGGAAALGAGMTLAQIAKAEEADKEAMGDLARQDLYPAEQYMQPPPAIPASTGEGYAGLGGDPSHLASTIKNWWTNQPSWLQRAQAENQKTSEAFQRGGMGEIAKQLATDTNEAQDLYGAFGVGNIKGVRPPLAPGALAATSEYHPPFYSAVEQAVQGAKQNAAPGQQWAGFLRNQPGVKPEEVEALKLGKLFEQPGSVPKEAVLGEIAANRVNVGEVVKGQATQLPEGYRIVTRQELARERELDLLSPKLPDGNVLLLNPEGRAVRQFADMPEAQEFSLAQYGENRTKFQSYTLPGGENYREMLLTLPEKTFPAHDLVTGKPLNFRSSHYDEPNILAHVRYNDRVIDGKKTLFVEEVQSDWHQKGKREGYAIGQKVSDEEAKAISDKIPGSRGAQHLSARDRENALAGGHISQAEHDKLSTWADEYHSPRGVPDAPFKTTWPELAMKRIIREAAEKGYDKVAWTPGSVQADRYDLSQHIDHLRIVKGNYQGLPGGVGYGVVARKGGRDVFDKRVTLEELPDVIGKEMADKAVKELEAASGKSYGVRNTKSGNWSDRFKSIEEAQDYQKNLPENTRKQTEVLEMAPKYAAEYKGLDLKVGGEGMKGFYDEILPATVNRLVKKHGGRVQQGQMASGDVSKFDIEQTGSGWRIVDKEAEANGTLGRFVGRVFQSGADAEKWLVDTGITHQPVHTIEITPSLRAAAMKGFPLFTAGGVAATGVISDLARQDEYR